MSDYINGYELAKIVSQVNLSGLIFSLYLMQGKVECANGL